MSRTQQLDCRCQVALRTGGQVIFRTVWIPFRGPDRARSGCEGSISPPPRGARRHSGCRVRDSRIVTGWRLWTGVRTGGQVICRTVWTPSRGPDPARSGYEGSISPPHAAPVDNPDVACPTIGLSPVGACGQGDRSSVRLFGSLPGGLTPPNPATRGPPPPSHAAPGDILDVAYATVVQTGATGGQVICPTLWIPSRGPDPARSGSVRSSPPLARRRTTIGMSRTQQLDCRRLAFADRGTGHLWDCLIPFPRTRPGPPPGDRRWPSRSARGKNRASPPDWGFPSSSRAVTPCSAIGSL
jgi:hypothetical protein